MAARARRAMSWKVVVREGVRREKEWRPDEGKAAFDEWTAGLERSAPIFLRDGGPPWNSHDEHRPMKAACEVAQIKPAIGFHSLRRSYASLLVKNRVSLAVVAETLGHADTRMVSKLCGGLLARAAPRRYRDHFNSLLII